MCGILTVNSPPLIAYVSAMEWMHYRTLPLQHIKGSHITYMYIRGVSTFNSPLLLQCQRGPHFEPSLIVKYIHRGGSHSTHPQWCNTYIGKWRGPLDRFNIYIGEAPTFNRPYLSLQQRHATFNTACTIYMKGPHFQLYLISTKHQRQKVIEYREDIDLFLKYRTYFQLQQYTVNIT